MDVFNCRITISLKKRLMSSYNLESIKAVAWGITHEEHALKKYEHEFTASVQQTGNFCYLILIISEQTALFLN